MCCQFMKKENILRGIAAARIFLLFFLLFVAPFHAFLLSWMHSAGLSAQFSLWLSVWREFIVFFIGILVVAELLIQKKWPRFDILDWLILAYFGLTLVWLPFQRGDLLRWFLGVRFDVMPFLFCVVIRHTTWPALERFLKPVLIAAAIILGFGILQSVILPPNFLTHFGYVPGLSTYNPDVGGGLPACQYLEHSQTICRAFSTFGGPTRYGTYLLLIIGLLFPFLMEHGASKRWRLFAFVLLGAAIVNIILTFSRSIWVAAVAGAIFAGILFMQIVAPAGKSFKNILRIFGGIFLSAAAILLLIGIGIGPQKIPLLKTVFIRDSSSSEHYYMARQGLITASQHPLGLGMGTSGPATYRFQKSLTENWYLQVAVETGLPGLLLFGAILFFLFKKLLTGRAAARPDSAERPDYLMRLGLAFCLFGICVAAFFTHALEETSTMLMLAVFVALAVGKED